MEAIQNYLSSALNCTFISIDKIEDDYKVFNLSGYFESEELEAGSVHQFLNLDDDKLPYELEIKIGDQDAIIFNSRSTNIDVFCEGVNDDLEFREDDEELHFHFRVYKSLSEGVIQVLSEEHFFRKLNKYSLKSLLFVFEEIKFSFRGSNKKLLLKNYSTTNSFETTWIKYLPKAKLVDEDNLHNEDVHYKSREICYFPSNENSKFSPYDFYSSKRIGLTTELDFLSKLCIVFCVGYLFDLTELSNENSIKCRLSGYKTLLIEEDYLNLNITVKDVYFKIFSWVYSTDGNLADKCFLARNIISLYLRENGLAIDGNVSNSILSNYRLYLRENVNTYISVKNELSKGLVKLSDDTTKLAESYLSKFQTSVLAFISLFSSLIIIRVLKNDGFSDVLNLESTLFIIVFLVASFIYLIYSNNEIGIDRSRLIKAYQELKERYTDVLVPRDIDRLTNGNKKYNDELSYLEGKIKRTNILWVLMIILFLVATLMIYFNNHE